MLSLLKIGNLALVERLVWEPQSGFLAITGETGAGKSVVMGGIALALGERGDKGMIRTGADQCTVEASFRLARPQAVDTLLDAAGIPPCEDGELLVRRVMTPTGNRQFINASPAPLRLLKEIGRHLVDRHRPGEQRSLTSQERQLELLDAFAGNAAEREAYRAAWQAWSAARQAYETCATAERASERELDYLRHQIEEIESAGFTAEETTTLELDWQRAHNAARLRDGSAPLLRLLSDDEAGLLEQMRRLLRGVRDLARLDESASAWAAPLETTFGELEDFEQTLQRYLDSLDDDPAALADLAERIALLDTLKRKYGHNFAAIEAHLATCREQLDAIEHREEKLAELEQAAAAARDVAEKAARRLGVTRKEAAPKLAAEVLRHARELGFRQARFEATPLPLPRLGPQGAETVDFLFGPNPGEPVKSLRLIASSGEMARVMLALKSALAAQDDTPLLLFDEIDANVGGEIARAVGMKMSRLGATHQVISITHFPQVAALADSHYLIEKVTENDRAVSTLRPVKGEERIDELVRMLGGGGESTRAHARDLLARGQAEGR